MAVAVQNSPVRKTLADVLLDEGIITQEQHDQALNEFEITQRPIARILVDIGAISEKTKLAILKKRCGCEIVNLEDVTPRADAVGLMTREQCRKHHAVPLRLEKDRVLMAMDDPTDVRTISVLETICGREIKPVLALNKQIEGTISRYPELKTSESEREEGRESLAWRVLKHATLPILAFGPLLAFFLSLYEVPAVSEWWKELQMTTFEVALFFVVSWGTWAAIAYFLNDLIFGKKLPERV